MKLLIRNFVGDGLLHPHLRCGTYEYYDVFRVGYIGLVTASRILCLVNVLQRCPSRIQTLLATFTSLRALGVCCVVPTAEFAGFEMRALCHSILKETRDQMATTAAVWAVGSLRVAICGDMRLCQQGHEYHVCDDVIMNSYGATEYWITRY